MSYDHGRFVWFELVAGDHAKAKAFYPELLGWKLDPMKMPDGSSYPLLKAGGTPFGGLRDLPREGVPPHWVSYVSVADVDTTAKKVVAEGGKTLMDAISVPTVGRMQPVADPEGSVFMLFHAESGDPEATQGAGAFHWNELWAKDPKAVAAFYEKVLGYQHSVMEMPSGEYLVLKSGDAHARRHLEEAERRDPVHVADLLPGGRLRRDGETRQRARCHSAGRNPGGG